MGNSGQVRRWLVVIAVAATLGAGCDGDDGTDAGPGGDTDAGPGGNTDAGPGGDTDAGPGGDTDAGPADTDAGGGSVPGGTIRGTATRSGSTPLPEDGMGTLIMDYGPECPYPAPGPGFTVTGVESVPNVDMSAPNSSASFEITGLAAGHYAVWGWLHDDPSASAMVPNGNLTHFNCAEVDITATQGAEVSILFDTIL